MSRLTDLEAEVEALRMLVGDLSDAVNTKEPKEDPADKDAKVDKPDREEVKKDQEDIGFNELLRQQEEANEVSALERFRTGPSALEDFNNSLEVPSAITVCSPKT